MNHTAKHLRHCRREQSSSGCSPSPTLANSPAISRRTVAALPEELPPALSAFAATRRRLPTAPEEKKDGGCNPDVPDAVAEWRTQAILRRHPASCSASEYSTEASLRRETRLLVAREEEEEEEASSKRALS